MSCKVSRFLSSELKYDLYPLAGNYDQYFLLREKLLFISPLHVTEAFFGYTQIAYAVIAYVGVFLNMNKVTS